MRSPARLERASDSARRCYTEYCAESRGCGGGKSTLLWAVTGEAEHGCYGLVRAEVSSPERVLVAKYMWRKR